MFKTRLLHATRWGLGAFLAMVLVACSGGGGGSGGGSSGTLAFFPGAPVDVRVGNNYSLTLSLENSSGVSGQIVSVAVADTTVATVDHSSCALSSGALASECQLIVKGIAAGTTQITASAPGYSSVSLPVVVSEGRTVNYGVLAVAMGPGDSNYTTTSPVTLNYPSNGQIKVYARIVGSQLLTTGTTIRFTPAVGTASPTSCVVTTAQSLCSATISGLPASGTTAITVSGNSTQGAGHTYSNIIVNATPQSTTNNGQVVIAPDKRVNLIPNGLKGPVFANWQSVGSVADTPTLTLSIAGWNASSPVSFYSYSSGNNTTPTKSGSVSCILNTAQIDVGCGFGILASADAGVVTITGSLVSANGQSYATPDPITITAIPNLTADAVRVVTFTNASTIEDLWIGITGGAASAYLNPTTNAGSAAGQRIAKQNSQANSKCGPTNPRQACPMGSSCLQPGQNPSGDFVCFWDQPTPVPTTSGANPYLMTKGGGTTKMLISKYSLAPGDTNIAPIHWSGNFYARQQCDANGTCKIGSCNSAYSGAVGGCAPGTGASPLGVVTLGEVTFQATTASTAANAVSDYYDVSIINGVNKSLAFGVTNVTSGDPYQNCGIAGSTATQGGGYPASSATGIGTATWQFAPSASSYPAVAGVPTSDYGRFFRLVDADSATATQCASATNPNLASCSGAQVCGYANNNSGSGTPTVVQGGANFTGQDLYCGNPLAWITADTIWPVNKTASNQAPFGFNAAVTGVSVGNLQICEGGSFSAYTNSAQGQNYACGGVAWDNQTTPVAGGEDPMTPISLTRVTEPVQWSNPNWIRYVQPTLLWLKQACPSCYTYPFDDKSSTFQCYNATDSINYSATFGDTR